jgi:hypothetical protein
MTLRILTHGENDNVWMTTTANVPLAGATVQVRTFPDGTELDDIDALPWEAPEGETHPDANSVRYALNIADAVYSPTAYVMQGKVVVDGLTIIESGYYWVSKL